MTTKRTHQTGHTSTHTSEDPHCATFALMLLIDKALADYYLNPVDTDIDIGELAQTPDRYVLLERGHYGQTWVSTHATPADASAYTLGQEYAEDWHAEVLIDRETGAFLTPAAITWKGDQ